MLCVMLKVMILQTICQPEFRSEGLLLLSSRVVEICCSKLHHRYYYTP